MNEYFFGWWGHIWEVLDTAEARATGLSIQEIAIRSRRTLRLSGADLSMLDHTLSLSHLLEDHLMNARQHFEAIEIDEEETLWRIIQRPNHDLSNAAFTRMATVPTPAVKRAEGLPSPSPPDHNPCHAVQRTHIHARPREGA